MGAAVDWGRIHPMPKVRPTQISQKGNPMKPGIYEVKPRNCSIAKRLMWDVSRRLDNGYAVTVGTATTPEGAEEIASRDPRQRGLTCSLRMPTFIGQNP